jgi:outer membrane murein-binding lipoprotein Lpp
MSDPSLFETQNSGGATPPQNTPANTQDDMSTLLSAIKNERGEPKYKDVKTALDALRHSQEFIPNLKNDMDALKAELEAAKLEAARVRELESVVERITQGISDGKTQPAPLDQEAIAKIVENTLSNSQRKAVETTNVSTVINKVRETFGQEAEAKFYQKAEEAGLSRDAINSLAKQSPAAVFKILGIDNVQRTDFPSSRTSAVNTSGTPVNTNTYIQANTNKSVLLGATTEAIMEEQQASRKMVDELHAQGKSIKDLTDPKVFFKTFGKK